MLNEWDYPDLWGGYHAYADDTQFSVSLAKRHDVSVLVLNQCFGLDQVAKAEQGEADSGQKRYNAGWKG